MLGMLRSLSSTFPRICSNRGQVFLSNLKQAPGILMWIGNWIRREASCKLVRQQRAWKYYTWQSGQDRWLEELCAWRRSVDMGLTWDLLCIPVWVIGRGPSFQTSFHPCHWAWFQLLKSSLDYQTVMNFSVFLVFASQPSRRSLQLTIGRSWLSSLFARGCYLVAVGTCWGISSTFLDVGYFRRT